MPKAASARDKSPAPRVVAAKPAKAAKAAAKPVEDIDDEGDVLEVGPALGPEKDNNAENARLAAVAAKKAEAENEKAENEKAVKEKKEPEVLANAWSIDDIKSKPVVVIVYAFLVVWLFKTWTENMLMTFFMGTVTAFAVAYSLFTGKLLHVTVGMLVVLGGAAYHVMPDKTLNSVETMQKTADTLLREFAKTRTKQTLAEECFDIQYKDPDNPFLEEFEKEHGRPFEPANDRDWDAVNTFLGCEIAKK
jgi:hypothetical protein